MLPKITFRTTGDELITTGHGFGNVDAGSYVPGSSGWEVRIYNDFDGAGSEDATSVKINVRSSCGETDLIWHEQHWVEVKSYGYSTGSTGMTDDNMTTFQPVGENSPLGIGDITSTGYRTLFVRVNTPTDAQENDEINLQLIATYQDPQTAITKWITGLRGNGVVASTGDPFEMSTGGTAGTIPYKEGYALIDNNEIYYGSSGTFDCSTGTAGTNAIYLAESGAFGMTTGTVTANQLQLYEATISSGVCTELTDKRVYLAGLQSGTIGAMPSPPDKGDLYLDITNGDIYIAKTAGSWTLIVSSDDLEARPTHLEDQLFFGELVGDASNQNTTGIGVLYQKLGAEIQLKGIHSTGNILVTDSTGTHTINLDINSTGIPHNDLGALDTGDYQHLTQAEHDEITGDEQAIATTTGPATIDWRDGRNAFFTRSTGANGTVTFSFTAPTISANLSLIIRGSTAGSTGTVTWPTVYWQGASAPSLSSGVGAIDKIGLYYSTGLSGYLGESLTNYSTV